MFLEILIGGNVLWVIAFCFNALLNIIVQKMMFPISSVNVTKSAVCAMQVDVLVHYRTLFIVMFSLFTL